MSGSAASSSPAKVAKRIMIHERNMQNLYRRSLFRIARLAPAVAALGVISACSSSHAPPPQQEFFETGSTSPFSRSFEASSNQACEAARRALLSQGYLATATRPDTIDASRDFQPSSDQHITVEFHVVCTPGDDPEETTVVYANAVQSGYALKKSDTSASVGFSVLGSVSLPIRSNSDSMVKVSSETIQSSAFYKQFFEYVAHYLHKPAKTIPVPHSVIKATQVPGGPLAVATPPAPATPPATAAAQAAGPSATADAQPTSSSAAPPQPAANAASGANAANAPAAALSTPPAAPPAEAAKPAQGPQATTVNAPASQPTTNNAPAAAPASAKQ
jgi:hypothetical protein